MASLRDGAEPAELSAWLSKPRVFRTIGAIFDPARADQFAWRLNLAKAADVLVFGATSTPTTLINVPGLSA
jgi:hypothetical protein